MRQTFAVILSCPPDLVVGNFSKITGGFRFWDPATMWIRQHYEISRFEIEGVDQVPACEVFALIYALGTEAAWKWLGAIGPIGYEEAAEIIAGKLGDLVSIQVVQVPNYPIPQPHGLQSPNNSIRCPKCGAPMHIRKPRGGGSNFYGCAKFPDCKGTRNITDADPRPFDDDKTKLFQSPG